MCCLWRIEKSSQSVIKPQMYVKYKTGLIRLKKKCIYPEGFMGVIQVSVSEELLKKDFKKNNILLQHSYLFIKFCASPSNLWGSVSTVIGCSITSWFLMMMQFQVGKNLKGMHHTAVAMILSKQSATRSHRRTSRRPHTRTHT